MEPEPAARPEGLPDDFWDEEAGRVRLEELIGAYGALASADRPPESPEGYELSPDELLGAPDGEVNRRLHAAGFTNAQAQLVYDMAAELLLPLAEQVADDLGRADRDARLAERFGGEDGWRRARRQLEGWAGGNLPPGVGEALLGSVEGVAALERLMDAGEPGLGGPGRPPNAAPTLDGLRRLQADPRYWRDREPEAVAEVLDGYARLYPGARPDFDI